MTNLATFELHQINFPVDSPDFLQDSFNHLPQTEYADGKFRLRRYSVIKIRGTGFDRVVKKEFSQTDEYNKFQPNVIRQYDEILDRAIFCFKFKAILDCFKRVNKLLDDQEVEIHQMRILAQDDGEALTSPEGIHQDGFRRIAIVGVNRYNITGGNLLVYRDKGSKEIVDMVLETGEMVVIDDEVLWHSATAIKSIDKEKPGYMDVFILTTK